MKKRWLLWLFLAVCSSFCMAQQLPRQVISSAGSIAVGGSIILSWTVGQPGPVGNPASGPFYITQGFQQGDEWWVSLRDDPSARTAIRVYPNPSGGLFHLEGTLPGKGRCNYFITDPSGKQILSDYFLTDGSGGFHATVDLSALPAGVYYLKLYGGEGERSYTGSGKLNLSR